MNVYLLQQVWLDETYYPNADVQRNYWTINFPISGPNIKAQIALTIFSPGIKDGQAGFAATGIKSYSYWDEHGEFQSVILDHFQSHLTVLRCLSITFALDVSDAWAGAVGMIYWFKD